MNKRIHKKLSKKKKREEVSINALKFFSKLLLILFYLSLMTMIIITDGKSALQTLMYLGAIILTYIFLQFATSKIIQNKIKIIDHINKQFLSELSLKE